MNPETHTEENTGAEAPELVKPATLENAIEDLSMAICKLNYAVTLMPGSKEQRKVLAEAMALAEPYTPQVEDNHDEEAA